jgi:O-antigen/teichoic acid export membrane protein
MSTDRRATPSLSTQAFWLLLAKTFGFALTLGLPLVLVRSLSQVEFGLYKQAFLVVGTAMTVLPLGFGMSAFYFLPRDREQHSAIVLHILIVHAAVGGLAALALALWPGLLTAILGSDALSPYAAEIGAVVFTWTVASFLDIIAVARQDVAASTLFIIASQASKTAIFIIAALAAGSVRALIDAAIVQGVVQIGVLLIYMRARFPGFWRGFDWATLQTQASYALPLGLSSLVLKFQSDLPHYFVAHAFGASEYAIFAVGVFNLPLIGLLRESVGSVMLPRVSRLEQDQDRRQILELVARVARKLALFYFPIYVFLMVVGREFITVLFTRQYLASWPLFAVYMLVIPFGVIVLDPITRAYATQRFFLLKLRLVLFAVTIGVLAAGAHRFGLLGTVAVMVAVQIAGTLGAGIRLSHVMGLGRKDFRQFGVLWRIGGAALAAGVACAATRLLLLNTSPIVLLIVCAMTYGLAYAGAILAAGVLDDGEWSMLQSLLRREWLPARRKVAC